MQNIEPLEIRLVNDTKTTTCVVGDVSVGDMVAAEQLRDSTHDDVGFTYDVIAMTLLVQGTTTPVFNGREEASSRIRYQDFPAVQDYVLRAVQLDDNALETRGKN